MEQVFETLKYLLVEFSNPEKQKPMEKYMKNLFPYLGVSSPNRAEALKIFNKAWSPKDHQELIQWVELLWNSNEREFQYVAMETFHKNKKLWVETDVKTIEFIMTHKSWWDSIDFIAANIVGDFFQKFPHLFEPTLKKWIDSNNMWVNRTAIICQLKYKDSTNLIWLEKAILPHIKSKEFFHLKAIGWALRQFARTDVNWVIEFVNKHPLKPLSRREALKHHKHLI